MIRTQKYLPCVFLLVICLNPKAAPAEDPVYFPDANLKAAVEQALQKANPTPTDMLRLSALQAFSSHIASLTGLEYAVNLTDLRIGINQISDISTLAHLTRLVALVLYDNQISDVSPLAGLTGLTLLSLYQNPISNIDPLAGLTNLQRLELGWTQVTDIGPLAGMTNLVILSLFVNHVSDVGPLAGMTHLELLELYDGQISDISPLSGLTRLKSLNLGRNQISDIGPLAGMTQLQDLNVGSNQINDISPLAGLSNVMIVNLQWNRISDISSLAGLTNLQDLSIPGNEISDISPLSGLTGLTYLHLAYNHIGDIGPLAGMPQLQSLFINNNRISDISPLVGLGHLSWLSVKGNLLDSDAYCIYLPAILEENPTANLSWDANRNPPAPVSASDGVYSDKVQVTWGEVCSVVYPTLYRVWRSTSVGGWWEPLSGWQTGTTYDDTSAIAGAVYYYLVQADKPDSDDQYGHLTFSLSDEGWRSGAPVQYTLSVSATAGGSVFNPGEGDFLYDAGTVVPIVATAEPGFFFIGWSGAPAGKVANPASASTTVTLDAGYTLVACFEFTEPSAWPTLTISSSPGGHVSEPGEGAFEYENGMAVSVMAEADGGHQFTGWTGTAVDAGKVADPESASITLTMDADYTLTANFEPAGGSLEYRLAVSAGTGGYVSEPGEGTFAYEVITTVPVVAHAYTGYRFSRWTGTAVNAGKVASTTSENTTVMVDGDYSLQANFVRLGQFSVKVLAPNGGETLLAGGTFAIHWQTQGEIANLSLDLTVDGGSTWTHVSSPSASTGSYDWPVPEIDSDRCLVRICVLDNAAVSDVSDAFFSIRKPAGHIWYVDAAAAPGGDGTSWETAFICLQDGLARAADRDSVWVAEGLYWPDLGGGQLPGNRAATFGLKNGVAIYGGFPAGGGTWEQRNALLHQSVLSGDIGESNVATDNSYHVVNGSGTDKTAILDGFTITGGVADGIEAQDRGAGLYNLRGSPQVHNCILVGNAAAGDGGGAWNSQSDATFINCVFNGNSAGNNGGGLYSEQGDVTITNCTFAANEALWRGGGVFNASGTAEVVNCILWDNSRMGGASYDELAQVSGDPKPTLSHCCVQGWTGSLGGQNNFGRDPLFVDADGPDNVVGTPDDDLRLSTISPCIDKGDDAAVPPEVVADQQGDPRIISNAVDMGAYEFGGMPAPSETGGP